MAIKLVNIHSNEVRTLTRPHQIGAYINSSDLGVNGSRGQDFGWRLAPEVVVKIEQMSTDIDTLESISKRIGVAVDEITTIHLVQHLSYLDDLAERGRERQKEREPEFKKEYEARIEAERQRAYGKPEVPPVEPVVFPPEELRQVEETATTLPVSDTPAAPTKKSQKDK